MAEDRTYELRDVEHSSAEVPARWRAAAIEAHRTGGSKWIPFGSVRTVEAALPVFLEESRAASIIGIAQTSAAVEHVVEHSFGIRRAEDDDDRLHDVSLNIAYASRGISANQGSPRTVLFEASVSDSAGRERQRLCLQQQ